MENYNELLQKQREFFLQGKTKSIAFRLNALHLLKNLIKSNELELMHALKSDLNKSQFDSYITEIGIL